MLSFRLNHQLHGLWAPGFHSLNIAAHALVCVLYFWSCLGFGLQLTPSLIAALLFAAHPIHTEAVSAFSVIVDCLQRFVIFFSSLSLQVANVVGRSEMLAAVFFLLALIAYQKAIQKQNSFTMLWVLVTISLSVTSLLCKEQGITVLGLCLVSDLLSVVDNTDQPSETRGIPHKHKQISKQTNTRYISLPKDNTLITSVDIYSVKHYIIQNTTLIFLPQKSKNILLLLVCLLIYLGSYLEIFRHWGYLIDQEIPMGVGSRAPPLHC